MHVDSRAPPTSKGLAQELNSFYFVRGIIMAFAFWPFAAV